MPRLRLLLGLMVFAALLAVVAPALSARVYVPDAVDFEMAAPGGGLRLAGASGKLTSPVVHAPKRFNVVGLRWASGAEPRVWLRARATGEGWSPWREVASGSDHAPDPGSGEHGVRGFSDPAWAGDADYVQYRLSRPVPGLRLHFVNTLGTATAADRLLTGLRRFANRGVVAGANLIDPPAEAASGKPAIVSRSAWGAKGCVPRSGPSYGTVKMAFVHHTVTLNDYTPDESPSIVLGICRFHRNSNGWNDIGYNFLVDKYGTIFEGRAGGVDKPVLGAQAEGFNSQSTGIANLGDYTSVPQTSEALNAMASLIKWKLPLEGVPTTGSVRVVSAGGSTNRYPAGTRVTMKRISGHRDGNATGCPGDMLYAQLPELRRLVGDVPPAPRTSTRVSATATPEVLEVPQEALVSGVLTTATGAVVRDAPVQVQALRRGKWRRAASASTDSSGAYSATVAPKGKRVLRVVYGGAESLRRSHSPRMVVNVRPDVTLAVSAARVPARSVLRLRGGVRPRKGRVVVTVQRRRGSRWARAARFAVRPRANGRFGKSWRVPARGRYRAVARFGGDKVNLSGRSPWVEFAAVRATNTGGARP